MGVLKIIFYIILAIVVFSLISTYIISINAPEVASLIGQSITSFFKGANSNSTLTSKGVNFTYPGNWLIFSPSVVTGVPILSQNNNASASLSNLLTNSSVYIIFPNSYISSVIGDIPSVISGALSENTSLSKIESLINKVNLVVVSDFNTPSNFSNITNINEVGNYLKGYNINTVNYSSTNLSGYFGLLITDKNVKIPQINNLTFSQVKVAVAVTGKTVCMVLGLASQNNSANTLDNAFVRVVKSIKCRTK